MHVLFSEIASNPEIYDPQGYLSPHLADFDLTINQLSAAELLRRYQEFGFLYPSKMGLLEGVLDNVLETWDRSLRDSTLFSVLTCSDRDGGWSMITLWRSGTEAYTMQALLSNRRNPRTTCAVIVAAHQLIVDMGGNWLTAWFRPTHPVCSKIAQEMESEESTGTDTILDYSLYPLGSLSTGPSNVVIDRAAEMSDELRALITDSRGKLFVNANQLSDDLHCTKVNENWKRQDMFQRRLPLVAHVGSHPVGLALCHRAPFGLNPSLLENKCDIILDHSLEIEDLRNVVSALLDSAATCYADFPIGSVPVTTDYRATAVLESLRIRPIRQYAETASHRGDFAAACKGVIRSYLGRTASGIVRN